MTNEQKPAIRSASQVRLLLGLEKDVAIPTVAILAHVLDQATGEAFYEIVFKTDTGDRRSVRFSKELLHHPTKVRDLVTRFDATLPRSTKKLNDLIIKTLNGKPPNWWQMAPALGWHNECSSFVLHDRVLGETGSGKSNQEPKIVPPNGLANAQLAAFTKSGDLKDWKSNVAALAKRSSAVTLGLSVAFAAPLLAIFDWPTFMVVLHGEGKSGKSTAALAGATVLGIGLESKLPNWNLKDAALPEIAQCFNDLPLILNGLETKKMNNKDLRDFLKSVTYILGDGVDTVRHSSWGAATRSGAPVTWRTIALATSELSFDQIAARAGEERMGGEQARAINVPAVKPGNNTIIDMFTKVAPKDPAERAIWARKRVEELREACAQHHGVALEPYLEHLMKQGEKALRSEIEKSRDVFVKAVKGSLTSEPLAHAAKNFGVIYAGGVQAIRAQLLTLTEEELLKRLKACFTRSIKSAETRPDAVTRGLKMLSRGLQDTVALAKSEEIAKVFSKTEPTSGSAGGRATFTVHAADLFGAWFGDDAAAMKATLRWLCEKDLLEVDDREVAFAKGFTTDTVRHTRRIQGKSCASIVFRDPRPDLTAASPTKS